MNRLRRLRFDAGELTQHEVASRVGVSQAQYWKWEYAYAEPTSDEKKKLARVFKVRVNELMEPEAKTA